jgi:hypothetical protein
MVEDERARKKTHQRWLATELAAEGGDDGELQENILKTKM